MSIAQDYIDLFSGDKSGHLAKYTYSCKPELWDELLKKEDYYLFPAECTILNSKLAENFNYTDVYQVIEVGPGSGISVTSKTIPFLKLIEKSSKNKLSKYVALDLMPEYTEKACKIVKENFKSLEVEAFNYDFMSLSNNIQLSRSENLKNFLCFFGSTFSNLNNVEVELSLILNNFRALLEKNDYFLCGIDINKDPDSLQKAYDNDIMHELLINVMRNLKAEFNLKDFKPEEFDATCKWNEKKSRVEGYLKPRIKQEVAIGQRTFILEEDQHFFIGTSIKFDLQDIVKIFKREGLLVKDVVINDEQDPKFATIISQFI
ncbi:MAG: L-histidine N(alpha)-methyltransferase [Alphaproteobacteria bacterium]|nr:L-histidine N(alpha)-methyltransferase [Alphaproteobacteria bacterium]